MISMFQCCLRRTLLTCGIIVASASFGAGQTVEPANDSAAQKTQAAQNYAKLPLSFEANRGQADKTVQFLSTGSGYSLFLTDSSAVLALTKRDAANALPARTSKGLRYTSARDGEKTDIIRMHLGGANRATQVIGVDRLPGTVNYFIGNNPAQWRSGVPTFARIKYAGVYPGIDLVYYGNQRQLEYDFIVAPGANPNPIRFEFAGAGKLKLTADGHLAVSAANGAIAFHKPVAYQLIGGMRQLVDSQFSLLSKNAVGFTVGPYDHSKPLVIDPVLDYSTYLANLPISVAGAAVDTAGNTYIVGSTSSASYPTTSGAFQTSCPSCPNYSEVFISKLNAAGTALIYSTFLGGSNQNVPTSIAVDSNGNAAVTGWTLSADFPLKNPFYSGPQAAPYDGFVASLSADGSSLNFSSRLGGPNSQGIDGTTPGGIAVDSSGAVYVVGETQSPDIQATSGALNAGTPNIGSNPYIFLTKIMPTGALAYQAILGDAGFGYGTSASGLVVDLSGDAYVTGTITAGADAPVGADPVPYPTTPGAFQSQTLENADGSAPFVSKVAPDGASFVYSTLVGQGGSKGLALTANGEVILIGTLNSIPFPVTSNAYSSLPGSTFIAELSADGTQMPYATYFNTQAVHGGGYVSNVAVDGTGDVWVAGDMGNDYGAVVPLVNPIESVPSTGIGADSGSAFVTEFDPQIQNVLFSTYFGGPSGGASVSGLALDTHGRAHIAGIAADDLPTTASAYLGSVTPAPPNSVSGYGYAALIDSTVAGPAICFSGTDSATAPVGVAAEGSFTISNCGNAPLNIANLESSSPLFTVASGTNCLGTVSPGASCTVSTSFIPIAPGTVNTTITVTSNAPIPTNNISISGLGASPAISVQPSSVTFPTQVFGVPGSTQSVIVSNIGFAPLMVDPTHTTVTGDFSIVSNTCSAAIPSEASTAPNVTCAITLSFTPAAVGIRTGTLAIASNDPLHPSFAVPLYGNAVASQPAATTTTLTSSSPTANQGAAIAFTATVSSALPGAPTGSVTFYDGVTNLGNETLTGSTATYTTSALSAGSHSIRATYSGDSNYLASTSTVFTQLVAAPGYMLSASPPSLTIASGSTGSTMITLTPVGGFTGTVNFSCGTLPSMATCSFSTSNLAVASSSTALTATLTIGTTGTAAAALGNRPAGSIVPALLAALLLLPLSFARRILRTKKTGTWLGCLLLFAATCLLGAGLLATAGCSGGSNAATLKSVASTPAGSYTVPISVTGNGSTSALNLSITIH
jgi:Bacterial Ig-like domain (group 3)/Beta-propeller repeat/Protein of unknown function (DUF1573)